MRYELVHVESDDPDVHVLVEDDEDDGLPKFASPQAETLYLEHLETLPELTAGLGDASSSSGYTKTDVEEAVDAASKVDS